MHDVRWLSGQSKTLVRHLRHFEAVIRAKASITDQLEDRSAWKISFSVDPKPKMRHGRRPSADRPKTGPSNNLTQPIFRLHLIPNILHKALGATHINIFTIQFILFLLVMFVRLCVFVCVYITVHPIHIYLVKIKRLPLQPCMCSPNPV